MKPLSAARLAAFALALVLIMSPAALASVNLWGVRAEPNQKLAFRTGPNTAYGELYTLPQSTAINALELEEGNGVVWVLVDFEYNGSRVRAYTGLKRMSLSGGIPYANHDHLIRRLQSGGDVYASPDMNAAVRATLAEGDEVDFLGFEGDYCFIEYRSGGELNRGYVRQELFWIDQYEYAEYFPENDTFTYYAVCRFSRMYAQPSERSELLFSIPFDASVTVDYWEIEDTPDGWLPIYYGGLHGYGRYDEFCDLRFATPEQARAFLSD